MSGVNLINLLQFIVSTRGAVLLSLIIVALGGIWLWRLWRGVLRSRSEVRRAATALESVEAGNVFEEFERVSADFNALSAMGSIWEKYAAALIFSPAERRIWSTVDPGLLWDEEALLEAYINLRWHRSVPNVLTGLGLLGTFVGLVSGIYLAKDGLASGDPAIMQEGLGQLLGGAYAAFFTSIAGIAMSFAYSALEKRMVRGLKRETGNFCRALAKRIPVRSHIHLLGDIAQQAREQTAQMKSFSDSLAISLGEVMSHQLSTTLAPTLAQLVESVEALREEQRSANQSAIEQMIAQFQSSLSGAAGQEFQALSSTLNDLTSAADSIRSMLVETHTGIRGELEAGISALREGMQEFASDFRKNEAEAAEARRLAVEELHATVDAVLHEIQAKAALVVEVFGEAGKQLHTSVHQASQEMAQKILTSGDDLVRSAEAAREVFEKAGHDLEEASKSLRGSVSELGAVIDAARRNESESVQAWTGLTERMRQVLGSAADLQADIHSLAEQLGSTNEAMQLLGERLRMTAEQLDATSSVVQDLGRTVQGQAGVLTRVWEEQRARFEHLDQELAQAVEQVHLAYEKLSEDQRQFLVSLEEGLSNIVSVLSGAVEEISELVEGLAQR